MKAERLDNTKFQGKVVTLGKYSKKPEQCLRLAGKDLTKLVQSKDYNLYLEQDYSRNIIKIACGDANPFDAENISAKSGIDITANTMKYIVMAKQLIKEYDANLKQVQEKIWEKEQKKAEIKDAFSSVLFIFALPFLYIAEGIKEGTKDLNKIFKFNKIAK